MTPAELAKRLTDGPITDKRLQKFARHMQGDSARPKRDDAFVTDALNAIEASHGADVREQARQAVLKS